MELLDDVIWGNRDDFGSQNATIIIDSDDLHTVGEGLDTQFLEEGGLGVGDSSTFLAHHEILGDFDLSLLDLGGNLQGVEEGNLRGVESSGSRRDDHIAWGNDTYLGGSLDSVSLDGGLEFVDGLISEDQTNLLVAKFVELVKGWDGFAVVSEVLGVFVLVIDGVDAEIEGFSDDGLKKDEKVK